MRPEAFEKFLSSFASLRNYSVVPQLTQIMSVQVPLSTCSGARICVCVCVFKYAHSDENIYLCAVAPQVDIGVDLMWRPRRHLPGALSGFRCLVAFHCSPASQWLLLHSDTSTAQRHVHCDTSTAQHSDTSTAQPALRLFTYTQLSNYTPMLFTYTQPSNYTPILFTYTQHYLVIIHLYCLPIHSLI